jgi:hypothetical protein
VVYPCTIDAVNGATCSKSRIARLRFLVLQLLQILTNFLSLYNDTDMVPRYPFQPLPDSPTLPLQL